MSNTRLPVMTVSGKTPSRPETDEEINQRIMDRFDVLGLLAEACTLGTSRSLIVSGPAGLGKSYTVEEKLSEWDPSGYNHLIVKGYVRATGLLKLLYNYRKDNQVLVFDDADTIFFDDTSLNILKAVCDTTEQRRVSWLSEGTLIDDETGEEIPKTFDFNGTIIFITNLDFDAMIDKRHKLTPHLQALVSRSHYIDLALKTRRDYLIRIKQVVKAGMLSRILNNTNQETEVMDFIEEHQASLRELSLRMAIKIANLRKSSDKDWQRIARVTCCK